MTIKLGVPDEINLWVIILWIIQFLLVLWISERFKSSLQWEQKVRERAMRVAEFMVIARDINENKLRSFDDYRKSNQLSWELAMWLPEDIYKEMGPALIRSDEKHNVFSVIVAVRKYLLGRSAGHLTQDDIIIQRLDIRKQINNKDKPE